MILTITNRHPQRRTSRRYLEKRVKKILQYLDLSDSILDLTFVTDRQIARLNRLYLRKSRPTDVLSFPMDEGALLGDIVISLDTAARQAGQKGESLRDRCLFLVIHGLLHLLGYNHVRHRDWVKMRKKEEELYRTSFLTFVY